ncbi:MAG TPA: thiamine phosphate synthase [Candidatus Acidoferrum sp.]|nr:thiamine phosphate synthase [Candidatus Acidoferrum sp.]
MPIERNNPVVCYVTGGVSLRTEELGPARVRDLREAIRRAVAAGADWVQIRERDLPGGELLRLTREAVEMANGRQVRIIVNDRLDVAVAAGAGGVHLGGQSLPVSEVSAWRGAGNALADFLIGASCHSEVEARAAERDGADYIFFGPVFATPEKLSFGPPQGLEKLREACRSVKIPAIAIGGVNAENAEECLRAGAAGIAAIRMFQNTESQEKLREEVARLHGIS